MSYPSKTNRFANQFSDLAYAMEDNPKLVLSQKCKNRGHADQIRLQFYAFRNAARKTGEIQEYPRIDMVEVTISKDNVITFQYKDYSDVAKSLDRMLGDAGIEKTNHEPLIDPKKLPRG